MSTKKKKEKIRNEIIWVQLETTIPEVIRQDEFNWSPIINR